MRVGLFRGVKQVSARWITGARGTANPARGSTISPRPGREGARPGELVFAPLHLAPPLGALFFLRIIRLHLDPAPQALPARTALAAPHGAPCAAYRSRRRLPSQPRSCPAPSPPACGKLSAHVTLDLAYLSPYQLHCHLTRCPREGGSIALEPEPSRPTPTRPAIG